MSVPEKTKACLGIALIICAFLPLSGCEKGTGGPNHFVPIDEVRGSDPVSWLFIVVFAWPLPLLAARRALLHSKLSKRIGGIVELLVVMLSIYVVYSILFFLWYRPLFWGYMAIGILMVYLITHLYTMLRPHACAAKRTCGSK